MAQTTDAINYGDLAGFYDQHMQDVVQPNANKGIPNEATCSTAAATAAKTVTAPASFSLVSGATILVTFTNGISVDNATLAVGSTAAKPIYYKGAALEADYVEAGDVIMLRYDGTSYNVVGKLGGRALPEVQIGGNTPSSESEIKLFVDESTDDTEEVYSKAQTNSQFITIVNSVSAPTSSTLTYTSIDGTTKNFKVGDEINVSGVFYKLYALTVVSDVTTATWNKVQDNITDQATIGNGYGICSTAATTAAKEVSISNFVLTINGVIGVCFQKGINVTNATLNVSSTGAKPIFLNRSALPYGVIATNTTVTLQYDGTNWNIIGTTVGSESKDELLVDLGLPSGIKWATRNIDVTQPNKFAASPYQYQCSFFSWGNTDGHNPISDSAFDYNWGTENYTEPYVSSAGATLTGNAGLGYDAAHVNLGGDWRMPTNAEFGELFANCDYINADGTAIDSSQADKRTTINGVVGLLLKSKINGKRIFFPASGWGVGTTLTDYAKGGFYTSSTYQSSNGRYFMYYSYGVVQPQWDGNKYHPMAIRPVQ